MICVPDDVSLETLYYLRDHIPQPHPTVIVFDHELGLFGGVPFVTCLSNLIFAVEERLEKQKARLEAQVYGR